MNNVIIISNLTEIFVKTCETNDSLSEGEISLNLFAF